MNFLTIAMLAVLTLGGLRGLLRGLITEVASLTALLLGGWLAYRFHEPLAVPLTTLMPYHAARIVSFTGLLLAVGLGAHLVGSLLTGLVKLALLGWVNRLGGLALGVLEGALLLGMMLYAVVAVPLSFPLKEQIRQDRHAALLVRFGGMALDHAKTLRSAVP
ncbi:CvpA family protein [Trichlorobacter ammonificans]|uniref:Colicin V production protein n=1 Tax=Trichlorobacter ammonificans TaxID=2916410 RepID=A0ABM9DBR7_9BACT|nr:CvpA family protein [Trichlorobacter ammonificans]CAH2031839.1 Colicin V production protein [Trichlorobacter ammonificans]